MGAESTTNNSDHDAVASDIRVENDSPKEHRLEIVGNINIQSRNDCLFDDAETECSEDLDDEDHMMPGLLAEAVSYSVKRVIVQGWVHKKGTGLDWLASRAWKARWAVLVLAKVSGQRVETPMLQIFWSPQALTPSTVILLSTAVVLPKDDPDITKWNCHRFEIHHVKKPVDDSFNQITRIFSCPKEGRDSWVYSINQALLEYEKEKAYAARKSHSHNNSPPQMLYNVQDDFPRSKRKPKRPSLPMSPSTVRSPAPLPEPPLVGVEFLEQE